MVTDAEDSKGILRTRDGNNGCAKDSDGRTTVCASSSGATPTVNGNGQGEFGEDVDRVFVPCSPCDAADETKEGNIQKRKRLGRARRNSGKRMGTEQGKEAKKEEEGAETVNGRGKRKKNGKGRDLSQGENNKEKDRKTTSRNKLKKSVSFVLSPSSPTSSCVPPSQTSLPRVLSSNPSSSPSTTSFSSSSSSSSSCSPSRKPKKAAPISLCKFGYTSLPSVLVLHDPLLLSLSHTLSHTISLHLIYPRLQRGTYLAEQETKSTAQRNDHAYQAFPNRSTNQNGA